MSVCARCLRHRVGVGIVVGSSDKDDDKQKTLHVGATGSVNHRAFLDRFKALRL